MVILIWRFGEFFLNCQTKVTAITILKGAVKVSVVYLGQSAKLNACQSVFAVKSPNLMFIECTTPTV